LVAMRERKPCRRLRTRLLGWKVRLVDTGHAPCSFAKAGEVPRRNVQVKQASVPGKCRLRRRFPTPATWKQQMRRPISSIKEDRGFCGRQQEADPDAPYSRWWFIRGPTETVKRPGGRC
jgi:hypothetical protein